ncbi:hypothetical protein CAUPRSCDRAFT_11976, partial [Caulochytrium protostelioides]
MVWRDGAAVAAALCAAAVAAVVYGPTSASALAEHGSRGRADPPIDDGSGVAPRGMTSGAYLQSIYAVLQIGCACFILVSYRQKLRQHPADGSGVDGGAEPLGVAVAGGPDDGVNAPRDRQTAAAEHDATALTITEATAVSSPDGTRDVPFLPSPSTAVHQATAEARAAATAADHPLSSPVTPGAVSGQSRHGLSDPSGDGPDDPVDDAGDHVYHGHDHDHDREDEDEDEDEDDDLDGFDHDAGLSRSDDEEAHFI